MATRGLHPIWPQADTPVEELPEAERLLLDAARAWGAPGGAGVAGARVVLASAGAQHLYPALDAALRPLSGLRLAACPLCPRVSADEGAFLAAVAVAQWPSDRAVALALLQSLAPPIPAYQAMPAVVGLGVGMVRLGLRLGGPGR